MDNLIGRTLDGLYAVRELIFKAADKVRVVHQLLAQDLDGHHRSHRDRAVFPHHDCGSTLTNAAAS